MNNPLPSYIQLSENRAWATTTEQFEMGKYDTLCCCCGSGRVVSMDAVEVATCNKGVLMSIEAQPTKVESTNEYKIESIRVGDKWLNFALRQIP